MGFIENPIAAEAHEYPIGFATLLIISDGSCEAGSAAAYIHQQFPFESGTWGPEADFSGVQVNCRLYTANVKLTDNKGNNGQVDGELLALHTAVELKNHIEEVVMIKFHAVRLCSDSLTVMQCIRKTDSCYSIWAGKRIAHIQRSIDVDNVWHLPGKITDACIDACTKYQTTPSSAMNEQWFFGKGVLDKPLQTLPWTPREKYAVPKMEDLPAQWLSTAAKTLLSQKLPAVNVLRAPFAYQEPLLEGVTGVNWSNIKWNDLAVTAMRATLDEEEPLLDEIADKHHQLERAVTVTQFILRFSKKFRGLPNIEQRAKALAKFWKNDYATIRQQLKLTANKIQQGLITEDAKKEETYFVSGRHNYRVVLLAQPKTSSFSRLVLRDAHNANHLTSSNRILVKVTASGGYIFTGGALPYLNKLRDTCMTCRRLQPRPIQQLMGDIPKRLRGIGLEDTTTWRHQTCDLFGPFDCRAWLGQRQGQRASQSLKTWALLLCDYSTRAVRAAIC